MRNLYLKKVLLVFVFLLFVTSLKAQGVKEELVLQVPSVHPERNLSAMVTQLNTLGGVEYVAFCPRQQLMMLNIDRNVHADNKSVINAFLSQNYIVYIKTGVSASDIISRCEGVLVPVPQDTPAGSSED